MNNEHPQTAWEYVDWLYISGRLTAEEHITLRRFLLQLEDEVSQNYCNEGC